MELDASESDRSSGSLIHDRDRLRPIRVVHRMDTEGVHYDHEMLRFFVVAPAFLVGR